MIGYSKELGLKVKNARLMTREELEMFQDDISDDVRSKLEVIDLEDEQDG